MGQIVVTVRDEKQMANAIKRFRKLSGLTQSELSRRSGIAQHRISLIESGRQIPTLSTFTALMAALNLEVEIKSRPVKSNGTK